jgi:diacylglycerol kinase
VRHHRSNEEVCSAVRSFFRAFKTIAWAFLGIRKNKDRERDFESLNIVHIAVAGLISAAVFIGLLMAIIHWIVTSPTP